VFNTPQFGFPNSASRDMQIALKVEF